MNFFEKFRITSQKNNSLLCVGLDPYQQMITTAEELVSFNRIIIKATAELSCAYKPNLAIYEGMGEAGLKALAQTLLIIRETNPSVPIIGDGKRGDIGNCSRAYTSMLFEKYNFDAVTVNPYMGSDSVEPFLQYKDRGIFILCRTSNPGGADIQELMVVQEGSTTTRPLYEMVAELAQNKWNKHGTVGLVVGATYPEQLSRIRQICPNMLFLIPGIGAQGGSIMKTVQSAVDNDGKGFMINVSRQIMYAAMTSSDARRSDRSAIDHMRNVTNKLRREINNHLTIPPRESQKQALNTHSDKATQHTSPQEQTSALLATRSI